MTTADAVGRLASPAGGALVRGDCWWAAWRAGLPKACAGVMNVTVTKRSAAALVTGEERAWSKTRSIVAEMSLGAVRNPPDRHSDGDPRTT
jgi:hypothetical protein